MKTFKQSGEWAAEAVFVRETSPGFWVVGLRSPGDDDGLAYCGGLRSREEAEAVAACVAGVLADVVGAAVAVALKARG